MFQGVKESDGAFFPRAKPSTPKSHRPSVETGQEPFDRQGVRPQKPGRFRDHGPTSQQRTPDAPQLLDARCMVFVGFRQYGYNRAGIYQYGTIQEPPNPSKCPGLVLRSRLAPFTVPISPAFSACSYAVSASSSAASCRSTATRTKSDSRVPARRAADLNRWRSSAGNRTVMR